jgi:integrase/recombinase XerD
MNELVKYEDTPAQIEIPAALPDLSHILAGQLAASSIAMYKRDVQAYVDYAVENGLSWLDPDTFVMWRDMLALGDKSPNTINRMISAVKRIIKEMFDRRMVDEAAAMRFEHTDGVKVKPLKDRLKPHARTRISSEDMRRLCNAPDQSTLIGTRDAALLATLASSAIRAAEASHLKLEHIAKRDGAYFVWVCGKTDEELREAPLSREAYKLIMQWIERRPVQSEYIFTSFDTRAAHPKAAPISEVSVWAIVQRYAKACGIEHIKPHDFRRFVGTQLTKRDIRKAQKALGHKSMDTTAKFYVLDELEPGLTEDLY